MKQLPPDFGAMAERMAGPVSGSGSNNVMLAACKQSKPLSFRILSRDYRRAPRGMCRPTPLATI
jgi:hypothetical protein